jgi:hypothetical protein
MHAIAKMGCDGAGGGAGNYRIRRRLPFDATHEGRIRNEQNV